MTPGKKNSYNSLSKISIDNKEYKYYSLKEAEKNGLEGFLIYLNLLKFF
jgi:aconitate hydratase